MYYQGEQNVPGAPGNLLAGVDLPFGGGGRYRTIQEQYKPGAPKENIPIRVFPSAEPGREGAIDVRFRQAQLYPAGQAIGNMAGMQYSQMPNSSFYLGPQLGQQPGLQVPAGYQAKYVS